MMVYPMQALRFFVLGALLAGLGAPALAETIGLRVAPRSDVIGADNNGPASLRFSLSRYDSSVLDTTMTPATPLLLGLPQGTDRARSNAVWADWFPFNSGLRTSAGLVWSDSRRTGNVFDAASDSTVRSRAFLGLGWTSAASSSSSGNGWRLDADVGASFSSMRYCVTPGAQCIAPGTPGLKPNSGGDGIRWNPFISIGASFQY
jgi:hypothetical protein